MKISAYSLYYHVTVTWLKNRFLSRATNASDKKFAATFGIGSTKYETFLTLFRKRAKPYVVRGGPVQYLPVNKFTRMKMNTNLSTLALHRFQKSILQS